MSLPASTVLILGGYGTFGGRLARLLAGEEGLTLLIAGRSRGKAALLCASLPPGATAIPVALDRDRDVEAQLRVLKPDLVVDASGPFQTYGENPFRVVEACLAVGAHYLDLADGSDFVRGIARFDRVAREKGVFVLSGVSTCPALTGAVVRHLARDLTSIEDISGGIAPSPHVDLGSTSSGQSPAMPAGPSPWLAGDSVRPATRSRR
jgi:saccharopine dehydrogenase-like NADP-dependent oxidoreductase